MTGLCRTAVLAALSVLCLCSLATANSTQPTLRLPFSYAWRFHYGPSPGEAPGPNTGGFPTNITGE